MDPAYVALALVPGIGRTRLDALLGRFGTAAATLGAPQRDIEQVDGVGRAAATAVLVASPDAGLRIIERTEALGGAVLTPTDPRFPAALRDIPDAPTLLFAAGRLDDLQETAIAIVGSRSHTRYGAEVCRHLAGGAARAGLVVVSGMARGIDAVAHGAALDGGGRTVGVLGNGLGVIYPSANSALYERMAAAGCLLTEFPPGERPNAGSFQRRNRLISGLARATLVIEAGERSGALITVDCALQQGHDVLAVPGPITSPISLGCNRLIQMGAKPALGLRDLYEEYGIAVESAPGARLPTDLTADEKRALAVLAEREHQVDDLAARLARTPADILAVLTSLEIRGLVIQEPGKIFRRAERLASSMA